MHPNLPTIYKMIGVSFPPMKPAVPWRRWSDLPLQAVGQSGTGSCSFYAELCIKEIMLSSGLCWVVSAIVPSTIVVTCCHFPFIARRGFPLPGSPLSCSRSRPRLLPARHYWEVSTLVFFNSRPDGLCSWRHRRSAELWHYQPSFTAISADLLYRLQLFGDGDNRGWNDCLCCRV